MKTIVSVIDHTLTWSQPKALKQNYELHFGNDILATMTFPKMLSTTALVESGDGSWELERTGFFNIKVTIRGKDQEAPLLTFIPKAFKSGGEIATADGGKVILSRNIWQSIHEVKTEPGEQLFEMKTRGFFKLFVDMKINRRAAQRKDLTALILLVFYLILMGRRDAAAHSAAH